MTRSADAIIIGGGIMGVNIALCLAQEKLGKVLLLEKTFLGAGSSGKSGAILRQRLVMRRPAFSVQSAFKLRCLVETL